MIKRPCVFAGSFFVEKSTFFVPKINVPPIDEMDQVVYTEVGDSVPSAGWCKFTDHSLSLRAGHGRRNKRRCHRELPHGAFAPLTVKETIVGVIARSGFCDELGSGNGVIPNSLVGDCFGKKMPRNDTAVTCFLVAFHGAARHSKGQKLVRSKPRSAVCGGSFFGRNNGTPLRCVPDYKRPLKFLR